MEDDVAALVRLPLLISLSLIEADFLRKVIDNGSGMCKAGCEYIFSSSSTLI
jgi:hypothetical protein